LTSILSLAPALPDEFLGGSAPRLQYLRLNSISFPALPELLLSATDLVHLDLCKIGYISPESIVTGLAGLTNLKTLSISFESPLSLPDQKRRRPPLPTRTVLPALTQFVFCGVSEYLEDLVARIDAPLLDSIRITFFLQIIFDTPQLAQFMRRATRFRTLNEARISFDNSGCQVVSLPQTRSREAKSTLRISCRKLDWQLSSLEQFYTSFFPSIHMMEHLYIYGPPFCHHNGKTTSRVCVGWKFSTHLPLSRVSTCPRIFHKVSPTPCKSLPGIE
jgi:hypothetical protein